MDRKYLVGVLLARGIDAMIWHAEEEIKDAYNEGYKAGTDTEEYKSGYKDGYSKGYDRGC